MAMAVVALVSGGLFLLVRTSDASGAMQVATPTATPAPELRAYVAGAVVRPGVYPVSEGTRLWDLIALAGGPLPEADLEAVNLAARVRDEDYWRIPRVGQGAVAEALSPLGVPGGKIDLNAATPEELETLPGIGQVRAQAIVAHRQREGPFARVEDLLAVRGIGPATLEAIRDLVVVR